MSGTTFGHFSDMRKLFITPYVKSDNYENKPIQIYWTIYHQQMEIFR